MNLVEFVKSEFSGWQGYEKIIFPLGILFIIMLALYAKDDKVAIVSAVCGISYTILAGKGKISCFFIGLCGTFCYSFIAYKNGLFGNLMLYLLYYCPMQIVGIFKWKKHLDINTKVIKKTCLVKSEKFYYLFSALLLSILFMWILKFMNDANPMIDSITTVFSVVGLILTVKRCVEQWYIWTIVNALSVIMWIEAYMNGSNCLATIFMWAVYFILGIYFLFCWNKELSQVIK